MKSNAALGRQPRQPDPEVLRLWDGISVFDSLERTRTLARRFPWRCEVFIAELFIYFGQFRLEKTRGPGHFTLWGMPHAILDCVRHVERA